MRLRRKPRPVPAHPATLLESLEPRQMLANAAFDLIQLTQARADSRYASVDGSGVGVVIADDGIESTIPELRDAVSTTDFWDEAFKTDAYGVRGSAGGHGTQVASIIGSRNLEHGIAPKSTLYAAQVFGTNGGVSEGYALEWAIANADRLNIKVLNYSGGSLTNVTSAPTDPLWRNLQSAIQRAEAKGITVVISAGNSYADIQTGPSTYGPGFNTPGVTNNSILATISAGSIQDGSYDASQRDVLTWFTQRLDFDRMIFSPGAAVPVVQNGGGTGWFWGTSASAPVISGVVALMQDAYKTFSGSYLTPTEVRQIMRDSADIIVDRDIVENPGGHSGGIANPTNTNLSFKRLNALKALNAVYAKAGTPIVKPPNPGDPTPDDPNGLLASAINVTFTNTSKFEYTLPGIIGTDSGGTIRVGPTDVDMFKLTLPRATTLNFKASTLTGNVKDFDAFMRVFNSAGSQIASDDNSGGNNFPSLTLTLQPGTYYVGMSGKGNENYSVTALPGRPKGAEGNYQFSIAESVGDPDGTISGALAVEWGIGLAAPRLDGNVGTDGPASPGQADVDFYRFTAPDTGFILLDIDSLGTKTTNMQLCVFDGEGNVMDYNDDALAVSPFGDPWERDNGDGSVTDTRTGATAGRTLDSFLNIPVTAGQVIYVGVSNHECAVYDPNSAEGRPPAGDTGDYSLFARFTTNDVNGSIDTAVLFLDRSSGFGEIGFDRGTLAVGNKDVDFLEVHATSSGIMQIDVNSTQDDPGNSFPLDLTITVYDVDGNRLAFADNTDGLDPRVSFPVQSGKRYFFAVASAQNTGFDPFVASSGTGGATGWYSLTTSFLPDSDPRRLSNDYIGDGRILSVSPVSGTTFEGELGVDDEFGRDGTDVDLYTITPTSNGFMSILPATSIDRSYAATAIRVFDSAGTEIFTTTAVDTEGTSVPVVAGQLYYIAIVGDGPDVEAYDPRSVGSAMTGSVGKYKMSVSFDSARPTFTGLTSSRPSGDDSAIDFIVNGAVGATSAQFFVDTNRNGTFDPGESIGRDVDLTDGLSYRMSVRKKWAPGSYLVGAIVKSASGTVSDVQTIRTEIRPSLANRVFYPEGWSNESSIDEFIPLINPNNVTVKYYVIAHYERTGNGDGGIPISVLLEEDTIAPNSRGGTTITTRGGIGRSAVDVNRGYSLEVQSDLPIGAVLAHYDNFNPSSTAAGVATGEALTDITSTSWYFPKVTRNPASNFEFLLFFNPGEDSTDVTVTFMSKGVVKYNDTLEIFSNNRMGLAVNDLAGLTDGEYSVQVTSTQPILGAISAYTVDGQGDSSIGVPGVVSTGLPSTSALFPYIDRSAGLSTDVTFFNPTSTAVNVSLTARNSNSQAASGSLSVPAFGSAKSTLAFAAALGNQSISLSYSASSGVAGWLVQSSTARGDSTFQPAMSITSRNWAIADAYLFRAQAGVNYFENLTISNPQNTAASITVDYLLYDYREPGSVSGQSKRVTRSLTIPAQGRVSIALHDAASPPMAADGIPEVHFSLVVRSSVAVYTTYTHWDLNQGGGWDTWATPVP